MRWKPHVRCGGRAGETDREQSRHRAPVRPHIIGAGQRSAIATLVERKYRTTVLVPLARDHSAQTVADALIAAFGKLPIQPRRTLTWDQGNAMFQHQRIEQATGLTIYFADPHSPWQRGSNKNISGLLRQYFPTCMWCSDA
jgi:IS30 family transposase